MNDRWQATYEWMGHIQDAMRQQDAKLEEILRLLKGDARDAQTLRADHDTLAEQVQEHERQLRRPA